MALGIGKLTILVGAGILGSTLANERPLPGFFDFVSSAFKFSFKTIRQKESNPSASRPNDYALVAQVNSLRHELQLLASNRPVTILTSGTAGGRRYDVLFVIVVVGCGYAWWKGWKLPDLSFATRRSLSDATASISKQLEDVYSSVSATKRNLSSRINQVDSNVTEVAEQNDTINQEVTQLRGGTGSLDVDIKSFHEVVQTLETKIHGMHGNEEETSVMVHELLGKVLSLETRGQGEQLQASPSSTARPALERTQSTLSRIGISPVLSLEPPSSALNSDVSNEVQQPLKIAGLTAGLKVLEGMLDTSKIPESPRNANESDSAESSSVGSFRQRLMSGGASIFSRIKSAS